MSLTGIHDEGNFAKGTVEYLLLALFQHGSLRDCLEAREKLKLIYSFCLIVKQCCAKCVIQVLLVSKGSWFTSAGVIKN